jgi:tetratricopeptide (TPR) repeat protein
MSKMTIRSFEEENKRRKTLRLVLFLISIPFLCMITLFGLKVLDMTTNATESVNFFNEDNFTESANAADKQKENNFIQPWLAYYNAGTAMAGDKNYESGVEDLTKALELVGDKVAQCQIRANLAVAYEKYGDEFTQAKNTLEAETQYASALKVIEEAPQDCFPPNSGSSESEEGESLEGTEERVESKQEGGEGGDKPATPDDEGSEATPAEATPEEKIEKQLEQSNEDRASNEAEERGSESTPSNPVEKPW